MTRQRIPSDSVGYFYSVFPLVSHCLPNPDQPKPRGGDTKQVENTSIGPGPGRVF